MPLLRSRLNRSVPSLCASPYPLAGFFGGFGSRNARRVDAVFRVFRADGAVFGGCAGTMDERQDAINKLKQKMVQHREAQAR